MEQGAVERQLRLVVAGWWVLALIGVLSLIAGVIVLAEPSNSLATLAVVTGIFFLFDGIIEVGWALFGRTGNRGVTALLGAISAIAGVFLVRHPVHAVGAIAIVLGLWLVVVGVLRLIEAFAGDERQLWGALVGALEVLAGIVIVSSPGIGVATLALLIGISLIIRAFGLFAAAWLLRKAGQLVGHDRRTAAARTGARSGNAL